MLPPLGLGAQRRHVARGVDVELSGVEGVEKGAALISMQTSLPMAQRR
ncbi:MAG: hypothetical protein M3P04_14085 [Actinomycetota bacterium]|nr:hypothetical protein [Actinomycetota bacterium]